MTQTTLAHLMSGRVAVQMFDCQQLASDFSSLSSSEGETYADIFKAQAETSTEFAKMLSSAQQSLNKPFCEDFAY